jgi:hypothetical protein
MSFLAIPALRVIRFFDGNCLNWTGGGRAPHVLSLALVRRGIVPERLLAVQPKVSRIHEAALSVSLTAIEVDDDVKRARRFRRNPG